MCHYFPDFNSFSLTTTVLVINFRQPASNSGWHLIVAIRFNSVQNFSTIKQFTGMLWACMFEIIANRDTQPFAYFSKLLLEFEYLIILSSWHHLFSHKINEMSNLSASSGQSKLVTSQLDFSNKSHTYRIVIYIHLMYFWTYEHKATWVSISRKLSDTLSERNKLWLKNKRSKCLEI
jgi:hypothetical protein